MALLVPPFSPASQVRVESVLLLSSVRRESRRQYTDTVSLSPLPSLQIRRGERREDVTFGSRDVQNFAPEKRGNVCKDDESQRIERKKWKKRESVFLFSIFTQKPGSHKDQSKSDTRRVSFHLIIRSNYVPSQYNIIYNS
jgi:hypothetical protein